MSELRLRYTRKGWYRFWLSFLSGTKDWTTGAVLPDIYGCCEREIWVGPYLTADEAVKPEII